MWTVSSIFTPLKKIKLQILFVEKSAHTISFYKVPQWKSGFRKSSLWQNKRQQKPIKTSKRKLKVCFTHHLCLRMALINTHRDSVTVTRNLKISFAGRNKTSETFDSSLPAEHRTLFAQKSDWTRSIYVTESLAVILNVQSSSGDKVWPRININYCGSLESDSKT